MPAEDALGQGGEGESETTAWWWRRRLPGTPGAVAEEASGHGADLGDQDLPVPVEKKQAQQRMPNLAALRPTPPAREPGQGLVPMLG